MADCLRCLFFYFNHNDLSSSHLFVVTVRFERNDYGLIGFLDPIRARDELNGLRPLPEKSVPRLSELEADVQELYGRRKNGFGCHSRSKPSCFVSGSCQKVRFLTGISKTRKELAMSSPFRVFLHGTLYSKMP